MTASFGPLGSIPWLSRSVPSVRPHGCVVQSPQWRWLIVDEMSMVSASLLAEMDTKLRNVIRDIGTQKKDGVGSSRPFGGLNVVMSGDFWQLAPPEGGFLADIPTERLGEAAMFKSRPPISHSRACHLGARYSGSATGPRPVSRNFQPVWVTTTALASR